MDQPRQENYSILVIFKESTSVSAYIYIYLFIYWEIIACISFINQINCYKGRFKITTNFERNSSMDTTIRDTGT